MAEGLKEDIRVKGEQLIETVKKLIAEGNVRQITLKDREGRVFLVLPLTVGVVGAVFAPTLAAIGAVAALVTECTISVERRATTEPRSSDESPVD